MISTTRTRPGWSTGKRAIVGAIACCALMFLTAFVVGRMPIEMAAREELVMSILSPLLFVTSAVTNAVDLLGPARGVEPPSQYLPSWVIRILTALSIAILIAALSCVFWVSLKMLERGRRGHA